MSLGLAFILFYKSEVNAIEAFDLFWGSVLALSETELYLTCGGAFLIIALTATLDLPTSPAIIVAGSIIVIATKGLEASRHGKPALHRR